MQTIPVPHWTMECRARDAETNIEAFKFTGPGWYVKADDTALLVTMKDYRLDAFADTTPDENPVIQVSSYDVIVLSLMRIIGNAPIRDYARL